MDRRDLFLTTMGIVGTLGTCGTLGLMKQFDVIGESDTAFLERFLAVQEEEIKQQSKAIIDPKEPGKIVPQKECAELNLSAEITGDRLKNAATNGIYVSRVPEIAIPEEVLRKCDNGDNEIGRHLKANAARLHSCLEQYGIRSQRRGDNPESQEAIPECQPVLIP